MPKLIDLTGQNFGHLVAISRAPNNNGRVAWNCLCECGKKTIVDTNHLRQKRTISCGCAKKGMGTTHGLGYTSEYRIWVAMKARCYKPSAISYKYYGGRGITMCEHWLNDVRNFYEDMGPRPSLNHSIDRIDNDGIYELANCRWATKKQQSNNRRNVR